ncbi:hypothetical protein GE061_014854 [Apolygus lucorum]|uniref:Uncharacterized protein n=1 Tax=Apolygus lucorum TaxID=248454 RepID=A0A8S9XLF1_APOLU|nr:hypothetical protein GE061_014854 [Apolygus lucorum]
MCTRITVFCGRSTKDSSVEVWKSNIKAYEGTYLRHKSKKPPGLELRRRKILDQLKTFERFYIAQKKKAEEEEGGKREDAKSKPSNEGESGYDSRSKNQSSKILRRIARRKADEPGSSSSDSPCSHSDLFSTCSPVKVGSLNNSVSKKKIVRKRETLRKDMTKSLTSSSSDDESEGERTQKQTKPQSGLKEVSQGRRSSPSDSDKSNDSDSVSKFSRNLPKRSPKSRIKKEQPNISDSDSDVDSKDDKMKGSNAKETIVNKIGDSTPKTSKKMKNSSPFSLKRFEKNYVPPSSNDRKSETSSSEDESESRGVPGINISPFVTSPKKLSQVSNQASKNPAEKSDSENESGTSEEPKIPDHQQPPNPNLKNSNDDGSSSNSGESESEMHTTPKKEEQFESGSSDSDSVEGSTHREKSSSGSDQSEDEIIPGTQDVSGSFASLPKNSNKLEISSSKQTRLVGASEDLKVKSKPSKKQSDGEVNNSLKSSPINHSLLKSSKSGVPKNTSSSKDEAQNDSLNKSSIRDSFVRQARSSSDDSDSSGDSEPSVSSKNLKETSSERIPTGAISHNNSNSPVKGLTSTLKDERNSDPSSTSDSSDSDEEQNTKAKQASLSQEKESRKNRKETSSERIPTGAISHNNSNSPVKGLTSTLKDERNSDPSSTSDSSDSDEEQNTKAKQASLSQEKESRKNSMYDASMGTPRQSSPTKGSTVLVSESRKRKADSISSSEESDNEHKNKVRKIESTPESVPFNSTRNPEVEDTSFPGGDISVIPKIRALKHQNIVNNQQTPSSSKLSAPQTKDPGSPFQKPGQLSIRDFARPIGTVSQTTSQNKYEALKQEYFEAGFSNLKERYDFESYQGLLEEDVLDDDNEVYVVQCPKEIDPTSLVGKEIDVSGKESVVELKLAGGQTVHHDVYCDLSDSEFGINIVIPSRNKKEFILNSVPVNGRLTIVESVHVPQIDEFDISSPPPIPLPDNLRERNSFIGSDESTVQISGKSKANRSKKAKKSESQESSSFIRHSKHESIIKRETSEEKYKSQEDPITNFGKLDDKEIEDGATDESIVRKKKKKKKKHELRELTEPSDPPQIVREEFLPPPKGVLELTTEKKKKIKKQHEPEELSEVESKQAVSEHIPQVVKEELIPPTGEKKKKKKKNREFEEQIGSSQAPQIAEEEFLHPVGESPKKKKKKKKRHIDEHDNGSSEAPQIAEEEFLHPVDEPPKKKKKKKRHLDEHDNGSSQAPQNAEEEFLHPEGEPLKKKKKKKHRTDEHTGDVSNSDENVTQKKKKKKKIKREQLTDED